MIEDLDSDKKMSEQQIQQRKKSLPDEKDMIRKAVNFLE